MPVPLRTDFDAHALRAIARKTKDGPQARRLRMHPASAALLGLGWGEIDTGLCWRDLYRAYVWTEGLLTHGGGQHAPILGRLGEARHC